MKPYQQVKISECGEPLLPIPLELLAVISPHPYQQLGAPYHTAAVESPYYLRQGVLVQLLTAQNQLEKLYPGWRIAIFDAYRPVEVQQFMVDYTFREVAQAWGFNPDKNMLSREEYQTIIDRVYQFWALPSLDPATPPPHSTGAALDITLVNNRGQVVDMGSEIDEVSDNSYPNYFFNHPDLDTNNYHDHRQILLSIMEFAGFQQHPNEWWHFSLGDQMWAWITSQKLGDPSIIARYGRSPA